MKQMLNLSVRQRGFVLVPIIVFIALISVAIFVVSKNFQSNKDDLPTPIPTSNSSERLPEYSPSFTPAATITPSVKPTYKPTPTVTPKKTTRPTATPTSTPSQTQSATSAPQVTTGTIEGRVYNSNGQAGYASVSIWCDCSHLRGGATDSTQADSNGYYKLEQIKAGTYSINAFFGIFSATQTVTVEAGKTTNFDITITPDPNTIPQTTIQSGPAPRSNPGDPANFYCTTIRITVNKCCGNLKVAMGYDNASVQYVELGPCISPKETYICGVLAAGSHTFYYKAYNTNCAEETLKSSSFTVN